MDIISLKTTGSVASIKLWQWNFRFDENKDLRRSLLISWMFCDNWIHQTGKNLFTFLPIFRLWKLKLLPIRPNFLLVDWREKRLWWPKKAKEIFQKKLTAFLCSNQYIHHRLVYPFPMKIGLLRQEVHGLSLDLFRLCCKTNKHRRVLLPGLDYLPRSNRHFSDMISKKVLRLKESISFEWINLHSDFKKKI